MMFLGFRTKDPDFLGVHLSPCGISGNKEAVSRASVLTTHCSRNLPFPFRLVPLKTDLFSVHLLL